MVDDQLASEDEVRQPSHEHDEAVKRDGNGKKVVFTHPIGHKRYERKPEKKMEIGPKDAAVDFLNGMEHVMVIVPVNSNIDETQDIVEKYGNDGAKGGQVRSMRRLQLEDHDGDDDGN